MSSVAKPQPTYKNIALVGGSGNLAAHIIEAFKQAGSEFNVTILTRHESIDKARKAIEGYSQFDIKGVDYTDKHSIVQALVGQEVAISLLAYAAFAYQPTIIEAAIEADVKWFIPSEFGVDVERHPNKTLPMFAQKLRARELLESQSKLAYTYILVGEFADVFVLPLFGIDFEKRTVNIPGKGTVPITFTSQSDIGKYTVAVLRRLPQFKNKSVLFGSFIASYDDWIAEIEQATGAKFTVIHEPLEELESRVSSYIRDKSTAYQLHAISDQIRFANGSGTVLLGPDINTYDSASFNEVVPETLHEVATRVIPK
ncbi:hypothetical protein GGI25_002277 [Coemansia spiralis]|uniref:NmrA-like domain-containing protein n=2 Tax=Coemansia TaxID=4863 RepID=A0A9W8G984_9FUNG|nr:hypothetical protein BX070DRAFT_219642 [Coemansia spiralis]KAJ1995263.1 hypothetical protein EDC05_001101 [Coemansia umbellata]KAJ2625663.1 hypothetical protein GGI26_000463 [Coemansia sp. RSA 1358]KAJ2678483.1 hypothetical protein GGI25_002277 [Coemansia spiralis]